MAVRSYRDLIVWQKSITLVVLTYRLSRSFPVDERFGLTAQIRRTAVSIPSNIAEGHGRMHRRTFRHFLTVARGSLTELETQWEIAERLGYVSAVELVSLRGLALEVGRMLSTLYRRLA